MALRFLIAEDDEDIAQIIAFGLKMNWPDAETAIVADGEAAVEQHSDFDADVIILDIGLPKLNGFEVCQRIRQQSQVPILMLTAHDATIDKVRALDLGADDYVTKPFDHLELLARLRALIRRGTTPPALPDPDFVGGDLTINFRTHEVRKEGEVVSLTSTEYRLLEELVRHAGTVMPHQLLLERVWGPEYVNDIHYVKVFIRRLRQKLGDDADQPRYIQTAWSVGYRFIPQEG